MDGVGRRLIEDLTEEWASVADPAGEIFADEVGVEFDAEKLVTLVGLTPGGDGG